MSSIAERLHRVNERIQRAALSANRDPNEITLVCVSKRHPESAILEAYDAGQRVFGENYVQELDRKAAALSHLPDLRWHMIGHLQTNKAKSIAKVAHTLHTLDSVALANELAKRLGKERVLDVLIEVNVSGEPQKHGASPGELEDILKGVENVPALRLKGLMTVPPFGDLNEARRVFETLQTLRQLHGGKGRLPDLSIGMSDDLEIAIACGATMVRVGTAVFGARR